MINVCSAIIYDDNFYSGKNRSGEKAPGRQSGGAKPGEKITVAKQMRTPRIDIARLKTRLDALNRFGTESSVPGVNRVSFSQADMDARRFLMTIMNDMGMTSRLDPVGNVIGRWEAGTGPAVMMGSHLDSVPQGGALDGVLGVVAALECVETLLQSGYEPASPIEVIATSEEEGRFGGMLGSQAIAGTVDPHWFESAADAAGVPLTEAMRNAGLDPERLSDAARDPTEVKAFLELHIEQGPVLDRGGQSVGIVEGISGVFNWTIDFHGEANHAGTTPMHLRHDSLRGLVDFAAAIPAIIDAEGTPASRLTVGKVRLTPNFEHTVPGRTQFTVVGRDMDLDVMTALAQACRDRLDAAATANGLALEIHEASWLPPSPCSDEIIGVFKRQAEAMGIEAPMMPSGAGHDTQSMAGLTKAGLIFVPSTGGVSHAPEEHTDWDCVEVGTNLLLRALVELTT